MSYKIPIIIIALAAAGMTVVLMNGYTTQHNAETHQYICIDDSGAPLPVSISYDDNDLIRSTLEKHHIQMSSTLKFTGAKAAEYCSFFADGNAPMYCTSTELVQNGEFLGNIHMVGMDYGPSAVLGVVQSDTIQSGKRIVTAVADSIIENTFDCMVGTSDPWIGELSERHMLEGMTTKSTIDGLPVPVLLELTGAPGGYLWKILIGNTT